ncbi:MAG: 6-carboxytetrahydropterin synthase [Methanosarcinales archaeon]|nr:6-carboxytetrahydropterin synthase [Methanosarcinales archaeon]
MWIELDGWMAKLRFSACHLIPDHPKCGRLHGHTYAVNVRAHGRRTGEFIIDFELLKEMIAQICSRFDHHIMIAENDPRLHITKNNGSVVINIGEKTYQLPIEDIVFIPIDSTSAESLCVYVAGELARMIKTSDHHISRLEVRIDEGIGQGAGCTMDLDGDDDGDTGVSL